MLIECLLGPTNTEVMGTVYSFRPDKQGRYVCDVENTRHAGLFLSVVDVYREADKEPQPKRASNEPKVEPEDEPTKEEPAAEQKPAPAITDIEGIGPAIATKLKDAGYTDVAQIANLSPEEAEALDEKLGLAGRISRDKWVEQARKLTGA